MNEDRREEGHREYGNKRTIRRKSGNNKVQERDGKGGGSGRRQVRQTGRQVSSYGVENKKKKSRVETVKEMEQEKIKLIEARTKEGDKRREEVESARKRS